MTTKTQPGTLDHREMWKNLINIHFERFAEGGSRRIPMTILANYKTLNMLVTGQDTGQYLTFEKMVIRTSYGDLYFLAHKQHDDGEMTFL